MPALETLAALDRTPAALVGLSLRHPDVSAAARRPSDARAALQRLGNVVLLERPLNAETPDQRGAGGAAGAGAPVRDAPAPEGGGRVAATPSARRTRRRCAPSRRSRSRSTPASSAPSIAPSRWARWSAARAAGAPRPGAGRGARFDGLHDRVHPEDRDRRARRARRRVEGDSVCDVEFRMSRQGRRPLGPAQGAGLPRPVRPAASPGRRHPRHHPAEAARERARGPAGGRAGRPARGRARRPHEGRVPRHAVARTAHAAQRHPRLDPPSAASAREHDRPRQGGGDDRPQCPGAGQADRGPARRQPHRLGQLRARHRERVARDGVRGDGAGAPADGRRQGRGPASDRRRAGHRAAGRPRPAAADRLEPAVERHQVHAAAAGR